MSHTPGPWHVGGGDRSTIYDKWQQRVANSFEGVLVVQRSDAECRSNARLIAAAPDLLEALQLVRDYVVTLKGNGHEYQLAIDAAIKKATQ